MSRSFSEQEKEKIRKNLQEACKQSWTKYGYKKTGVDALCRQAGISKGAFYLFYESKEALFCETICSVQKQICDAAFAVIQKKKNKCGAADAAKLIYREYSENNFLYGSDSADFATLTNRLSEEQVKKIEDSARQGRQLFLNQPHLELKTDADLAISVLYSLIMNLKNKDVLPRNHFETFDFMADCLIDRLYE